MARGSKAGSIGCLDVAVAFLSERLTNLDLSPNTLNSETQCDYDSQ